MKKNVFESCPKYLGALTWNHPIPRLPYTPNMEATGQPYIPTSIFDPDPRSLILDTPLELPLKPSGKR